MRAILVSIALGSPRLLHTPHPDEYFLLNHVHGKPHLAFVPSLDVRVSFHESFTPPSRFSLGRTKPVWLVSWIDSPNGTGPMIARPDGPYEEMLRGLHAGAHTVHAAVASSDEEPSHDSWNQVTVLHEESCTIHVAHAELFTPSYEWQPVGPTHIVPPGLEIEMDVGAHTKRARIPAAWTLKVGSLLGKRAVVEVSEGLSLEDLSQAIEAQTDRVPLVGEEKLASLGWSAAELFERQNEITLSCATTESQTTTDAPYQTVEA